MGLLKRLSLTDRVRKDKLTDIHELIEVEQRQWGPRMRTVASMGEPMAGLGFAGVVVPNNEVVVSPASVSSQTEVTLYNLATTGSNTWMYIPPGNFRAPQSWRVWAGGTFTTAATTSTLLWTTRVGSSAASFPNVSASIGATGVMAPGSITSGGIAGAIVTGAPWWYEAHLTIRTPGSSGTAIGMFNIELACQSPPANTMTGMGGTGASIALDVTQGALWSIGVTCGASPTTGAQIQHMTIVAWD